MGTRKLSGSAFLTVTAAVLAVSAALPSQAHAAGKCDASGASTCINSDTFWPHAGATQFASIGSTETIARNNVSFGLVTSYLSRPIVLSTPSPGPGGGRSYGVNDQVNGSFLFAFGILDRLQLDFVLPVTFGQGGGGASAVTGGQTVQDTALRDMRFGLAYAVVPRLRVSPFVGSADIDAGARTPNAWALTVRSELSVPTGSEEQFAGERGVAWVPSVVADYRRGRYYGAIELGARVRASSALLGTKVGSQGMVSAGIGVDLFPRRELLSVAVEARILPSFDSSLAPAEWMLSARSAPFLGGDLGLQIGGGGGIPFNDPAAVTTPRYRFMLGVRYAPLGRDTDGDGVLDKDDKCPYTHGAPVNGAGDGCPESKTAPTDAPPPSAEPAPTVTPPPVTAPPTPNATPDIPPAPPAATPAGQP